jgi:uncharacterized radical SAM superfamily Fe-S cluster-containing enzyme
MSNLLYTVEEIFGEDSESYLVKSKRGFVIIMQFIDAYNFDVRSVKKSCVHIVNKDYKIIPFETMNLFYRDHKKEYLQQLIN